MAPLFLMLLSALDEISVDYWTPVVTAAPLSVLGGAWEVFCWLSLVFLLLFWADRSKTADTGACRAVGSAFCRHFICGAVSDSARNLWKNTLSVMEYPAVTMMSTIKITGGFLKRTDAFMLAIWFSRCLHCLEARHFTAEICFRTFSGKIGVGRKIWIFHSCGGICAGRSFLSLKNTLHVL